jgi:hypothetical protein
LKDEQIFNRFIGTLQETPDGIKLLKIEINRSEPRPKDIKIPVDPGQGVRLGFAFRKEGLAQVLATLHNSTSERIDVTLRVEDDFTVRMPDNVEGIRFEEWVPGGPDIIRDNFNTTGNIDGEHGIILDEPPDFIRNYVLPAAQTQ